MSQVTGYIKRLKDGEVTDLSKQHEETLKRLGYTVNVSDNGLDLEIQGSQIWKEEIDLRDHETARQFIKSEIIAKNVLLSYGGKFMVTKKDETENSLPGNFALSFIDSMCAGMSCLVVKDNPTPPTEAKESTFTVDDFLTD